MPRERIELSRLKPFKDVDKFYILAYEGNKTEPAYYQALKDKIKYSDNRIEIIPLERDNNDTNSAPKFVFGKLKDAKTKFNLRKTDEFWMIIDKDRWHLDKWVEKCRAEENFFLAISNPSFEFWLLLHHINIHDINTATLELFRLNRKSGKKTFTEKYLTEILPNGYNKANLRTELFIQDDRLEFAILQAENLDSENNIMKNLGSHNYKLVKRLLN